jgi:NSS family neurotransmitter:Na+ symporter
MATNQRDGFSSKLGVLAATLGSAVGLGNIWKVPYMTGENGGASFLLLYIIATLVVGLPIMIAEIMMGRRARSNAVGTFRKLAPGTPWWLVGLSGCIAAFVILSFYTNVVGWVFFYIVKSVTGVLNATDPKTGEAVFGAMVSAPWSSLMWQWGVLVLISYIIIGGVSKGIEKTTKTLLPILFVMLLLVCARSLTLPKAAEGLAFLFNPDFSKITGNVVLMAMGLAFFKLSIGMGTMMTYGSYFRADANIPVTTTRVMLADLMVSMLAGIAIFPAVFNFGFEPAAGPGLLFMTIPAVFSAMPAGQLFMVAFFVLTGIATIGAMLSLMEVPVAFLTEALGWSRKTATVLTALLLAVTGAPATLSFSTMADVTVFGMNFFDFYDYLSSNILLPAGGLLICVFIGWVWGRKNMQDELSNSGELHNTSVVSVVFRLVRWVTPVLVLLVMLNGLGVIKLG